MECHQGADTFATFCLCQSVWMAELAEKRIAHGLGTSLHPFFRMFHRPLVRFTHGVVSGHVRLAKLFHPRFFSRGSSSGFFCGMNLSMRVGCVALAMRCFEEP